MVKLQALTLAAKLVVLSPTDKTIIALTRYTFALARYDINYDVRDRGRVLHALLAGVAPSLEQFTAVPTTWEDAASEAERARSRGGVVLRREQVRVVLFEGKSGVVEREQYSGACPHPSHRSESSGLTDVGDRQMTGRFWAR